MTQRVRSVARITFLWSVAVLITLALVIGGAYFALGGADHFEKDPGSSLRFGNLKPTFPQRLAPLHRDTNGEIPTTQGLSNALDGMLSSPQVGALGASIVDAQTGTVLLSRDAESPRTPASVTKIVTAIATLSVVDPQRRLETRVAAIPGTDEIVLVGGGDPTLAAGDQPAYAGAASVGDLAKQVRTAVGDRAITKIHVDTTLFAGPALHPTWDSDSVAGGYVAPIAPIMVDGGRPDATTNARTNEPDLDAGRVLATHLGMPADAVTRGTAPANGEWLATVQSPPVGTLVETMVRESDNVLAECLARQVAIAQRAPASFDGAATAVAEAVSEYGIPGAIELHDGSGLSRANAIAPDVITGLLHAAAAQEKPRLRPLFSGLPVAGYDGTLAERFTSSHMAGAAGEVRAKTGTLSHVAALAGVVTTADGRVLLFALLANNTPDGQARESLDRIATTIANCGC